MSKKKKKSEDQLLNKAKVYQALKRSKELGALEADSQDGDYASDIPMRGEKQIRTKTGDDGTEETHVTYVPKKEVIRMGPLGDMYDQIDWSK